MHSESTVLLIRDTVLLSLCLAELSELGIYCPTVANRPSELPHHIATLIVDLDAFPLTEAPADTSYIIGISRKEQALDSETRMLSSVLLHRPFSVFDFRQAVFGKADEMQAYEAYTSLAVAPSREEDAPSEAIPDALVPSEQHCTVFIGSIAIPLTRIEHAILLALYHNDGAPLSRNELASAVGIKPTGNTLDVHICAIRKKLAPYGRDHLIRTVRGCGYALLCI